jgi:acyl-CoA thioesterase-1
MRISLLPFALLVAFTAWMAPATAAEETPRIVALGDSLTSGYGIGRSDAYPAVLQARLEDSGYHYQVVNAGVSGDTTARALRRYRDALDGDVKILILALGANDGLRGVELTKVQSNLSVIIEDAQRRGWGYAIAFHRIYEELAAKYHVSLVPFVLMKLMSDPSLMQSDRAHPNKTGARTIADMVWPQLEPLLKMAE